MLSLRKLFLLLLALLVVTLIAAAFVIETIPAADTNLTHFDTIIVLGTPAKL